MSCVGSGVSCAAEEEEMRSMELLCMVPRWWPCPEDRRPFNDGRVGERADRRCESENDGFGEGCKEDDGGLPRSWISFHPVWVSFETLVKVVTGRIEPEEDQGAESARKSRPRLPSPLLDRRARPVIP